ncbi:MAG: ribonuclease P protein component [Bacteroidales bacterium]|nr:ribonuclease P protein component [Bacteroidales bacterium]MCF0200570.1 ribonuclease P protein component [Bacteroidales bacterium]
MTAKEDFPKYERLCKEKDIALLFEKGVGFNQYPYRVVVHAHECGELPPTCRLLISVSKKRFHHAFKRNRVKRLMRESWRKNKAPLYEICLRDNITLDVALVYNATLIHSYKEMFAKTEKAVKEIVKKYEKATPKSAPTSR